jgi:hypothetical protein
MKDPYADRSITRVAERLCPHCGYTYNAVGTTDGSPHQPEAGSVAICINCAGIAFIVGRKQPMRKPTTAETAALETDPDWIDVREARDRLRVQQSQGFQTAEAERGPGRPQ